MTTSILLRDGLTAFSITLLLCPLVLHLLRKKQVLDHPNARSSHEVPTPRGGGLAAAVGVGVALLASHHVSNSARVALLVVALGSALMGLIEDLWGIPRIRRLALQPLLAVAALPWLVHGMRGGDA